LNDSTLDILLQKSNNFLILDQLNQKQQLRLKRQLELKQQQQAEAQAKHARLNLWRGSTPPAARGRCAPAPRRKEP
jgi:endonuclease YncB( thermonuclease family)